MTTLTASERRSSALDRRARSRTGRLRALLDRMIAVAQADTARRSLTGMPDHLLRDLGLTRGDLDVIDL